MSAIHDLIAQVADPRLRERLAAEWANASREKKFGLVFESHLPELLPLFGAKPRKGDLVCRRQGVLKDVWQVKSIRDGVAVCVKPSNETHPSEPNRKAAEALEFPVAELLVVREFGEPIFPALTPVDAVANGPKDAPWHTLIEADNYHALQLLEYLYAGQVDCIYIDPPYNTGARDWKYNNDYVDDNDGWRHSKWLAFVEKRLKLAKRLLKPDTGVLVVTIDEHEVHHLGMLLERMFPDAYRQMVTIVITARGVAKQGLARVEEYAHYIYLGNASANETADDFLNNESTEKKKNPWASLLRRGTNAAPFNRPGLVYPILLNPDSGEIIGVGETVEEKINRGEFTRQQANAFNPVRTKAEAWPIRSDGTLGTWQVKPSKLIELKQRGFVKIGRFDESRINQQRSDDQKAAADQQQFAVGCVIRRVGGLKMIVAPPLSWGYPCLPITNRINNSIKTNSYS
jgi:adenine-specific DNA-methyltransferase